MSMQMRHLIRLGLSALIVFGALLLLLSSCKKDFEIEWDSDIDYGSLGDIEGNMYKTVTIGDQVWMAENLKTTKYNDGTDIPKIIDNSSWAELTTSAYCDYKGTAVYSKTFGRLYNWYTVNSGKLCPTGWHVPTEFEWHSLETYLEANGYNWNGIAISNGVPNIAKSLASKSGWKEFDTAGAVGNDQESNNSSGFTALPGGLRHWNGTFGDDGSTGYWWSSSEYSNTHAWYRYMYFAFPFLSITHHYSKSYGFSVRCVMDI